MRKIKELIRKYEFGIFLQCSLLYVYCDSTLTYIDCYKDNYGNKYTHNLKLIYFY